ncbi:MAG: molybdopterin-dependent oxidoreductase [Desulfobacteraceae bacterium]|nr:molybdopterin-dependent oxidoreductase [Desulfobacteraceae bacterium]
MNKGFNKKIVGMAVVLAVLLPFGALAATSVTIIRPESRGESSVVVGMEAMKPFATVIETVDPNFRDNGRVKFAGISVKQLFELAGAPVDKGVTVVGRDQYAEYIPPERVLRERVVLSWAMDGHGISRLGGGPLKIIYDASEKVHGSGYTWYVESMFSGTLENPGLIIEADNTSQTLFQDSLASQAWELDVTRVSIPSGFRHDFPGRFTTASGIPLKDLLGSCGITKGNRITLTPFAGPVITMDMALLDYPVVLVTAMGNAPLHPVFGGPFSIQFPLEAHPGLQGSVPESGAFFFLKKISIN